MFKFDHLTPVGVARFTLDGVHVPPSNPLPVILIGKHAGRSNASFVNAIMTAPEGREGGARTATQLDADDLDSARRIAGHVLTDWEHVEDEVGAPLPFTATAAEDLFRALIDAKRPDYVRAALLFFADADRFRAGPVIEASTLGKR